MASARQSQNLPGRDYQNMESILAGHYGVTPQPTQQSQVKAFPWFEEDVVPVLRAEITGIVGR
ncbi:MAG: hypothetical protein M0R33_08185 [Methylomonas sp.]|uniref:hypothetical protein n=1 Tax=Methylomonas sp. TaxID=418 RepID=UPI0025D55F41|nr:hypothetical protein [Methylomonas sp.]MCK9606417.1 hypothetical protein [Methylomonas sp.]